MNIAFFGEDQYSAIVLKQLIDYCKSTDNYQLTAIITTRPKPKGRKKLLEPNPIEILANKHNLKLLYYSAKDNELNTLIASLKNNNITLGILTSFGHILPTKLLESFENNIINIHPSLLPQYRGATPIQHTLALGDIHAGVSLFTLTSRIDDGEILAQSDKQKVKPSDTTHSLSTCMFELGASLLIDLISSPSRTVLDGTKIDQTMSARHNPPDNLIFTSTFSRQDGFVNWPIFQHLITNQPIKTENLTNRLLRLRYQHNPPQDSLTTLRDLHRALHPWPGIWTTTSTKKGDKRLKLTQLDPEVSVQLEGKSSPISWDTFTTHHLIQE